MAHPFKTITIPAVLGALFGAASAGIASSPLERKFVQVPEGTFLSVELVDELTTAKNKAGDEFRGRVLEGVWIEGKIAVPPGSTVRGVVVLSEGSGRIKKRAKMDVTLRQLQLGATRYAVHTDTLTYVGEKHAGKAIGSLLGGALQGAIYGVLFGGGEGAVIGAGAGAGVGAAGKILKGKEEIKFEQGARLLFETMRSFKVPEGAAGEKPKTPEPVDLSAPKKEEPKPEESPKDKAPKKDETAKPSS
jgi:hypothetical protein